MPQEIKKTIIEEAPIFVQARESELDAPPPDTYSRINRIVMSINDKLKKKGVRRSYFENGKLIHKVLIMDDREFKL